MPPQVSCHRKAMDLLARRSHFRAELGAKLTQRGYEESEVATTLERLSGQGFLDDRRTAEEFLRSRLGRKASGRRKLRHELMRRGVDAELADEVLNAAVDDDHEVELARQAAERWWSRRGESSVAEGDDDSWEARQAIRSTLARHLERRGFAGRAIVEALRAVADDG